MTMTITAVYKNGVLRPLHPLNIPENKTVTLTVAQSVARNNWIDNISPDDDPYLYVRAAELGERADGLHAWQLLPMIYYQGADGMSKRMRDYVAEGLDPLAYLHEYAVDDLDMPEDFSENLDHYLYGLPKRTDDNGGNNA